jgi:hypothetical protein
LRNFADRRIEPDARVVFVNKTGAHIEVSLEPYGELVRLDAGDTATFNLCGTEKVDLLVEIQDESVIAWIESGTPCNDEGAILSVQAAAT